VPFPRPVEPSPARYSCVVLHCFRRTYPLCRYQPHGTVCTLMARASLLGLGDSFDSPLELSTASKSNWGLTLNIYFQGDEDQYCPQHMSTALEPFWGLTSRIYFRSDEDQYFPDICIYDHEAELGTNSEHLFLRMQRQQPSHIRRNALSAWYSTSAEDEGTIWSSASERWRL
jgi:hypothetical protein